MSALASVSGLRRLAIAAALLLFAASPTIAQQAKKPLSLAMYLDMEGVSDPQLSPDGQRIVYSQRWVDKMNDRFQSSLWIMNVDGTKKRFLVEGSSPKWSPDGTRLAFLAPGSPRGRQIWVRWMDEEGATSQVTHVLESPSNVEWSPDGKTLAFQMFVPEQPDPAWRINLPGRPEGARWTADPVIEDRLIFRSDGFGWLPRGYEQIFVMPAEGGAPRQLTSGPYDNPSQFATSISGEANPKSARWLPDGRTLVFQALRREDAEYGWRESDVYTVDVATGAVRQLTNRRGPMENPVPSPDGRWIAFQGYDWNDDHYHENELYVMNADGSNVRSIAKELGQTFANLTWAEDSRGLYFNAGMKGTQNLWFAPIDGEPRAMTTGQHMLVMSDIVGTLAVGTRSSSQQPGSIVSFDLRRPSEVRTLHLANESLLADVKLGEVEEIWYKSADDLSIQGWIVKPPDFDPAKRYPLMLQIHGCARGMYNFGFDFSAQEFAANGYVVLYTNPRGSSGYGSAFGNQTYHAFPSKDYDDLMIGVDSLIGRGYIDERNLFVQGASGGGVLTGWIVGHTQRFTAAVARAMVSNWLSWVSTVDDTRWYRETFAKYPWDDPTEHLKRSPLMYVGNVTTPTMVLTGELDLTTPIGQAEQFYRALKMRKVPTAMVRIADAYHGHTSPPSNFMRVQLLMRNWFERYAVGGAPRATSSSGTDGLADAGLTPASERPTSPRPDSWMDGPASRGVECLAN
jgi:dipeptidyl aminopeptidase/acylaminoacyl peptidase